MVVRATITYATIVWWPRVKFKTSRAKLSMLQRMAFLGITGSMRMTPTAAPEVFFALLPLYLKSEAEA
jgi:hypothetical protein